MGRRQLYQPSGTRGLGAQVGTSTFGPGGSGQSASVGIAGYYEDCEEKEDPCINNDDPPWFSEPDSYSGSWIFMGYTVRTDGTLCMRWGIILTWPPYVPTPDWEAK